MKFKSFILLPAMMLILASCGPKEDSSSSTSSSSSSTSESTTTSQPVEVKYGSLEAPLKVDEFVTEAGKLKLGHQEFSKKTFFVEGYVDSSMVWNEGYGNFNKFKLATAKGSETMVEVSGAKRGEGVSDVYHNDTIVLEGLAEVYNDVLCIYFDKTNNNYPTIHKVTAGESMIKVTAEHASVTGLMEKYMNGAMGEFTVKAESGFEIVSVMAYGTALTETEGKYFFKVSGDGEVLVTTKEEGTPIGKTWQMLTEAPVEGVNYRAGLDHSGLGNKRMYLDGTNAGGVERRFAIVEDETKAAVVMVEVNGAGFNIKVGSKYLTGQKVGTYNNVLFSDTMVGSPWMWDATYNTFIVDVSGSKIFLGVGKTDTYENVEGKSYKNIATMQQLHFYEEK